MQFSFVSVVDESGRPSKTDRSLVRSRCMIGVNKKENSRRSKREARKKANASKSPSPQKSSQDSPDTQQNGHTAKGSPGSPVLTTPVPRDTESDNAELSREIALSSNSNARISAAMQSKSASSNKDNYSLPFAPSWPEPVRLGGHLDSVASQELLHRFATFSRFKYSSFPIERVVDFDSYKYDHTVWLAYDDAFYHSALFSMAAMADFIDHRPMSNVSSFHLQQTLNLLNERLTNSNAYLFDSTVFIIISLTLISSVYGHKAAVRAHLRGMKQVSHIGGNEIFRHNPKLNFKLDNIDLRWSLSSGEKPTFLLPPENYDSLFPGMYPSHDDRLLLKYFEVVLDAKLIAAYHDLQNVFRLVDSGYLKDEWLPMPKFQAYTHSIQSRLLHLPSFQDEPFAELLRLSLLTFMTTNFKVANRKLPYPHLAQSITKTFDRLEMPSPPMSEWRDLIMWMIIVLDMADVDVGDAWLQLKWDKFVDAPEVWRDARFTLKRVVWISSLHDEKGKESFEALKRRARGSPTVKSSPKDEEESRGAYWYNTKTW